MAPTIKRILVILTAISFISSSPLPPVANYSQQNIFNDNQYMTLTVGIGKCHNNDIDNDRWQNLAIFDSMSYNRDVDFINTVHIGKDRIHVDSCLVIILQSEDNQVLADHLKNISDNGKVNIFVPHIIEASQIFKEEIKLFPFVQSADDDLQMQTFPKVIDVALVYASNQTINQEISLLAELNKSDRYFSPSIDVSQAFLMRHDKALYSELNANVSINIRFRTVSFLNVLVRQGIAKACSDRYVKVLIENIMSVLYFYLIIWQHEKELAYFDSVESFSRSPIAY